MAKDKLTDYSATNASNTDVGGINIDEGCLPSGINNAIREVMTHLKDFESGTNGITKLSAIDAEITGTGAIKVPVGTTAQRPTPATGQLRFNSTDSSFEGYDGSAWGAIGGGAENSFTVFEYTATASQTTFSGADDNAATLSYTAGNIQVMLNGVVLDPSDFTATNGTSVVLASGAALNDVLNIYAFTSFSVADTVSASTGGTFSANVAVTGDLTVDTNTLYVDSTNNRVGIGVSSPAHPLSVENPDGNTNTISMINNSSNLSRLAFVQNGSTTAAYSSIDADGRSTGFIRFNTNDAEAMRIDSSGTVYFKDGGSSNPAIRFLNDTDLGIFRPSANTIAFTNGGSESARIDASGNLLLGKTTTALGTDGIRLADNDTSNITVNGGTVLDLNRRTSNGSILGFYKDGGLAGKIENRGSTINVITDPSSATGAGVGGTNGAILPCQKTGIADNLIDIGTPTFRWDDIYATNGTIQTSDQNEKQQIASLTDAEISAAKAISQLFKTFKWNDKVAEKGDAARRHTGVVAQDVEAAMTAAGLDAGDYAFFISTTWWEHSVDVPAVAEETDEDGNVTVEAQEAHTRIDTYRTAEEAPEGATERNRKGIRYPELLSFVGAATEQRLANIETRLAALENA